MYQDNVDKFAKLRAIASGQTTTPDVRFWRFETDGDVMGTISGFNSFTHPVYGEQHTVTVRLSETNELVSAFLSGWLQQGMRLKQAEVGDLILVQFFGKQPGERFNRFHLEIQKDQPELF
jgi:hypothetical protein